MTAILEHSRSLDSEFTRRSTRGVPRTQRRAIFAIANLQTRTRGCCCVCARGDARVVEGS